jgi:hypothetical protein
MTDDPKTKFMRLMNQQFDLYDVDHEATKERIMARGTEVGLSTSEARQLHGHAKAIVAFYNAYTQKNEHGFDCQCASCGEKVVTVERALHARIRAGDRGYV